MKLSTLVTLGCLLWAAAGAGADLVPVRTRSANLYEAAVDGSRSLQTYPSGTKLEILSEQPGWVKVRTQDGKVGYMRTNSLDLLNRQPGSFGGTPAAGGTGTTNPGTTGTGSTGTGSTTTPAGAGTGTASAGAPKAVTANGQSGGSNLWDKLGGGGSTTQASAAGKGFSEEVERNYREKNPDLEPYYAQIDQELLTLNYNRGDVLERFRRQGFLGEFAAQAGR